MTSQLQFARRRTVRNGVSNPVPPARQPDLRSTAENLLRDAALVLHATEVIRRVMKGERALCPAVS